MYRFEAADRSYASVQRAEGQGCVTRVRPSARRTSSIVRCLDPESAEVPSVQQAEGQGCVTQVRPSACRTSSSVRTMMPGSLQRFDPSLAFLSCASLSSRRHLFGLCTAIVLKQIFYSCGVDRRWRIFETSATLLRQRRSVVKVSLGTQ